MRRMMLALIIGLLSVGFQSPVSASASPTTLQVTSSFLGQILTVEGAPIELTLPTGRHRVRDERAGWMVLRDASAITSKIFGFETDPLIGTKYFVNILTLSEQRFILHPGQYQIATSADFVATTLSISGKGFRVALTAVRKNSKLIQVTHTQGSGAAWNERVTLKADEFVLMRVTTYKDRIQGYVQVFCLANPLCAANRIVLDSDARSNEDYHSDSARYQPGTLSPDDYGFIGAAVVASQASTATHTLTRIS